MKNTQWAVRWHRWCGCSCDKLSQHASVLFKLYHNSNKLSNPAPLRPTEPPLLLRRRDLPPSARRAAWSLVKFTKLLKDEFLQKKPARYTSAKKKQERNAGLSVSEWADAVFIKRFCDFIKPLTRSGRRSALWTSQISRVTFLFQSLKSTLHYVCTR